MGRVRFRSLLARGSLMAAVVLPVVVGLSEGLHARAAAAQDGAGPPVRLDRLMKLPDTVEYDVERRGGATRTEWRSRFNEAREAATTAKKDLDQATAKLEKAAAGSDSWRFVPPGGDVTAENQDNLRIRMDVTKKREALAYAEKRLKDLEVEANLASVPADWRN